MPPGWKVLIKEAPSKIWLSSQGWWSQCDFILEGSGGFIRWNENEKGTRRKREKSKGESGILSLDLIDELEQCVLSGVHPHGPHRPAQLFRADVSSSVNVKLIESLDKFHQKLNEERETGKPTEDRDGRSIGGIWGEYGNMGIWEECGGIWEYRRSMGWPVWVQQSVPHLVFVHPLQGKWLSHLGWFRNKP